MLTSKEYKHIAFPGWNWYPPSLKNSGGTVAKRAKNHTKDMYRKILFLVNNVMYFSGFTTQKYLLTAITPIVLRDASPNRNSAKAWNWQKSAPKIHLPCTNVATEKGMLKIVIIISLTARARINMLASVRSLWFLYTAKQTERLPKKAMTLVTANQADSIQTRDLLLLESSWEIDIILNQKIANSRRKKYISYFSNCFAKDYYSRTFFDCLRLNSKNELLQWRQMKTEHTFIKVRPFKGTVSRLWALASVICFFLEKTIDLSYWRVKISFRTAPPRKFSGNILDFRKSLSSFLKFGTRYEDLSRFCR